ncbi:predicted protein [Histoplasma capsulatum H143]|uniref:Uncharacterized protein n=1 Tax=Ajellomyces capsulatus (strain H143) TaxID=544712 RepID=C6HB95_AJECH|nr:predicted protein [Histoplasma capsulatum H143]
MNWRESKDERIRADGAISTSLQSCPSIRLPGAAVLHTVLMRHQVPGSPQPDPVLTGRCPNSGRMSLTHARRSTSLILGAFQPEVGSWQLVSHYFNPFIPSHRPHANRRSQSITTSGNSCTTDEL